MGNADKKLRGYCSGRSVILIAPLAAGLRPGQQASQAGKWFPCKPATCPAQLQINRIARWWTTGGGGSGHGRGRSDVGRIDGFGGAAFGGRVSPARRGSAVGADHRGVDRDVCRVARPRGAFCGGGRTLGAPVWTCACWSSWACSVCYLPRGSRTAATYDCRLPKASRGRCLLSCCGRGVTPLGRDLRVRDLLVGNSEQGSSGTSCAV